MNKNFYRLRRMRDLTQAQLGERLHIKQETVSNWERGKADPPIRMIPRLAEVLEISEHDLYDMFAEKYKEEP